ncbi:MAG: hypothetical protein ABW252_10865 [Polyangiales bacterium]
MNIGGVSRNGTPERSRAVGAPGNEVGQPRSVTDTSVDGQGIKVSLSKPVQMVSQLEDLKQNDPDAFEQTLSDSSAQLRRAAEEAEGPGSAQLSELATRFAQAAATGDLSSLREPPSKPESTREVTGHAGRAMSAYAKNAPVRARPDASVDRAMSAAFSRIEQATRAASATQAQQAALGPRVYA